MPGLRGQRPLHLQGEDDGCLGSRRIPHQGVRTGAAADIAFAVEEDFQGRGIASRLLRQLADIARASGIARFEADVLAENTPMLAVLRNSGLRMRTRHTEGVVHTTLFLT